jgi:phosphate transport system permease protein
MPTRSRLVKLTGKDWVLAGLTGFALFIVLALLAILLSLVIRNGAPMVSGEFLTDAPSADMIHGGIFPAIYGTVFLTLLMTIAGVPVGVATAIYLHEYAPPSSKIATAVRLAVGNLAGVPSVVFGLFGLGFFVLFIGGTIDDVVYGPGEPIFRKPSILWAALTLAILTLPVVIVTTEEALRTVPRELRDAALGLGATRFQTIYKVVLPNAQGGILTGVILAVSRGAGEVAPIMFCGAANFLPYLPSDLRDQFMHLGYHVFALATQSPNVDAARPTLYGTVFVLLALTFLLNLVAVLIRSRSRAALRG